MAIFSYFIAYNSTNNGSTIIASQLPSESISVKVFGENQNGSLTLVKVTSDEHFKVVPKPYPVIKVKWKTVKQPSILEMVDMPVLESIPFNGITPLEVPNPMVLDIVDLSPLSDKLSI